MRRCLMIKELGSIVSYGSEDNKIPKWIADAHTNLVIDNADYWFLDYKVCDNVPCFKSLYQHFEYEFGSYLGNDLLIVDISIPDWDKVDYIEEADGIPIGYVSGYAIARNKGFGWECTSYVLNKDLIYPYAGNFSLGELPPGFKSFESYIDIKSQNNCPHEYTLSEAMYACNNEVKEMLKLVAKGYGIAEDKYSTTLVKDIISECISIPEAVQVFRKRENDTL